jgi:hypothetical protein
MDCPSKGQLFLLPGYFSTADKPDYIYECFGDHDDFLRCPGGAPGTCGNNRDNTSAICTKCKGDLVPLASGECGECSKGSGVLQLVTGILCLITGLCVLYHFLSTFNQPRRRAPRR